MFHFKRLVYVRGYLISNCITCSVELNEYLINTSHVCAFCNQQIEYAANDAMVGVDIFLTLILAKMWSRKPDINIENTFHHVNYTEFWKFASSLAQGTIDANYSGPANSKNPAYRPCLPINEDEEVSLS